MKKFIALALAAASIATLPGVAGAQTWQSINGRQANQLTRINLGVRNGALTQAEANNLRSQFTALNRLEQQYRIGGLTRAEQQDLDRRFDTLSHRIYVQKSDRQTSGRWQSINGRQANQLARINLGIRNGALTAAEGANLRIQFAALNRLEQKYRIGGLTRAEEQDLDRRFDALSRKIYVQKNDRQNRR